MQTVRLNEDEQKELAREAAGSGGFQSLIEALQQKLDPITGHLALSTSDLEKIGRYAFDYGNGGFEGRLRKIFERELGPKLGR